MELSPEEQSFFAAGEALEGPAPQEEARRRHRSRRRSRRHSTSVGFVQQLRNRGWRKVSVSALLMIAAVIAGYWVSMAVAQHDLPDTSEFGVETRR
jgi:hypothetical protein